MNNTSEELKAAISQSLVNNESRLEWSVAVDAESLDLGEIKSSKYEQKTAWANDKLAFQFNSNVLNFVILPCADTGICETCKGSGEHRRFSMSFDECITCHGTGDCPCQFDFTVHGGQQ